MSKADVIKEDVLPEYREMRAALYSRLRRLADRVDFRQNYQVYVGITEGMKYPYLQVKCWRPDTNTGVAGWGGGGKAYVSEHATDSEIWQTMLGLLLAYDAHEVREAFRVDGKRVFGPHISTAALMTVCDDLDARP